MIAGSLEAKLPTIWTDGKAEVGRVREEKVRRKKLREEKVGRKKIREEKVRRKKIQEEKQSEQEHAGARKDVKLQKTMFFKCFVALEG